MPTHVAQSSIEAVEAKAGSTDDVDGDSLPRRSAETDADKVQRQRLIRRKTTVARRALAAHRIR